MATALQINLVADPDLALLDARTKGSAQGPGFSPQELGRVFERFRREPRAGRPDGYGLGLWIVRRTVERLGGTVRLISAPGEGALFLIELPVVE
jgi:signal transduction histidine kinase